MKTIIAGSRDVTQYSIVEAAVKDSGFNITEVVSGRARGADQLGEYFAAVHKIPVKLFPADWGKFGKSAGYLRNEQMAAYAEALIALWQDKSRGTKHMIDIATKRGLQVFIREI